MRRLRGSEAGSAGLGNEADAQFGLVGGQRERGGFVPIEAGFGHLGSVEGMDEDVGRLEGGVKDALLVTAGDGAGGFTGGVAARGRLTVTTRPRLPWRARNTTPMPPRLTSSRSS